MLIGKAQLCAVVVICAQCVCQLGETVQSNRKKLSVLLISEGSETAAMLQQLMEQQGLDGEIRRMGPGRCAVAFARHSGPYRDAAMPDLVMLDLSELDAPVVSMLRQVALGTTRPAAPVVLLTSPEAEALLSSGDVPFDASRVFAPTSLMCFVGKMGQHSRRRFLRSLTIMAELGPVLVRLPGPRVPHHEESALTA